MTNLPKEGVRTGASRRRRNEKGQVLLEFILNFVIFFFLLYALVIISMVASTKLLTNYAAFAAARAWSVNVDNGDDMDKAKDAAKDVLRAMKWNTDILGDIDGVDVNKGSCHGISGSGGGGDNKDACIEVTYKTSLRVPRLLSGASSSGIKIIARMPMRQESIKENDEKGDNKPNY
ncbi:MAG: hypothetical protein LAO21_14180 [Acidobacteriia bacterium]|nr:hypothetical protein [Terriglobia bacterium]